jgi:alkanesulfonate monooxygenase SsuD/methylene tetrahydromethanopterin reductase-like flavin-dependent oxidoreductase (luciferase family)
VQRPHPPLYFVANSSDSIDQAAVKGVPIFFHGAQRLQDAVERRTRYDDVFKRAGHAHAARCLLNRFIYVSETTARARREMERPFMTFLHQWAPDLRDGLRRAYGASGLDFDFLAEHVCIFGDVGHCVARVKEAFETTRVATLLATCNLITMPHAQCLTSMRLFAREVLPGLRDVGQASLSGWPLTTPVPTTSEVIES